MSMQPLLTLKIIVSLSVTPNTPYTHLDHQIHKFLMRELSKPAPNKQYKNKGKLRGRHQAAIISPIFVTIFINKLSLIFCYLY